MSFDDKITENVFCAYLSGATLDECESLIGKTIAKIEAREYSFRIIFTDESFVECSGNTYDGCSMGVEVENKK